jgi:phosphatidylinositol-3-phosphatase
MRANVIKRLGVAMAGVMIVMLSACGSSVASRIRRSYAPPPIRHVFVIMLENESYSSTFGDPAAYPYLAGKLVKRGVLLKNYYATGHDSNDNYISIVSGQPPNTSNQADCSTFENFTDNALLHNGVETGTGCVYPANVRNIGTELSARHLTWKAYMEDMGNDPAREAAACGHPTINAPDATQAAEPGDGYATRHDPFVYFHSVIDNQAYCDAHVVALGTPSGAMPATAVPGESGLATNLKKASSTPAFSFITPNLCDDGHDYPCVNQQSGASAAADIDAFLETWVPAITRSPAFKQGGLLEITFDEAADSDTSSCCNEAPGPGASEPGIGGPGGGKVGALLLSPYIKPGSTDTRPYNHYSSLASWEQLFGLKRLAYAATVKDVFGADVFNDYRQPKS